MIVLDASAALAFLFHTAAGRHIADLLERRGPAHAPHMLDAEVANGVRKYVRRREVTPSRGFDALTDFVSMDLTRYAHTMLLGRAWDLRENATAYDAMYIALAEYLGAPLVTMDAKIARTKGHQARVELIS